MVFAEFYQNSIPNPWNNFCSSPVSACGDRAVIILDGRERPASWAEVAREECKKRGFVGFTLNKGRSFSDSAVFRELELIEV